MNESPRALSVDPAAIPNELKQCRQWVVWRYTADNGKWAKPPYQPTGAPAAVDNPQTWSNFQAAWEAYRAGDYDGVGFVLADDDPYTAIDLDKCREPATGRIDPKAQELLERLDSYTEVSPSGTGLRIMLRGAVPHARQAAAPWGGKIEVYSTRHYVTLTGQRVLNSKGIEHRQEALDAVYAEYFAWDHHLATTVQVAPLAASPQDSELTAADRALLERARDAENGAKFRRLYDHGDTSEYHDDDSAADLALCAMLAYWTKGDAEQMDRLFRYSKLMRPKWDEPHRADKATYGQMTIEKAISFWQEQAQAANTAAPKAQRAAPASDGSGAIRMQTSAPVRLCDLPESPPLRFVVDDLIPEKAATVLMGDGGVGKSTIAQYIALCVATGRPAFGLPVVQGPVLYVEAPADADQQAFQRRMRQLATGLGLCVLPSEIFYWEAPPMLLEERGFQELLQRVQQCHPTLVILDSLTMAAGAMDMTKADIVIPCLERLKQLGTMLLIDHVAAPQPGKPPRPYGSTFKWNGARSVIHAARTHGGVKLTQKKSNYGERSPAIRVRITYGTDQITVETVDSSQGGSTYKSTADQRVLAALRQCPAGATSKELAEQLGTPRKTIQNRLGELEKMGLVRKSNGRWYAQETPAHAV